MGLKENHRGPRNIPEDNYYRRRLKEGTCGPEHSITLKEDMMHNNSLEDNDYNPSPGIV